MKDSYSKILEVVSNEEYFDYSAYHLSMLKRRIDNRIIKTCTSTPEKYLKYLKTDKEEPKKLVNYFMINVSHFFRDTMSFELIRKIVIPKIVSQAIKSKQQSIRIWSAGCARGEEPYSVAILFKEYFEKEKINLKIDFFATDIDETALTSAEQGEYTLKSLNETKIKHVEKYFKKINGKYIICPSIKSMVHFSHYNLLDTNSYAPTESIFGNFDLVLCRNVLIYFNQSHQQRIIQKFYKALTPNGILCLGESETPVSNFRNHFYQISNFSKIYEKTIYES
ncbi:MAG: chemotaxis protein CheR [Flavobacteriaceae bacterium]|nr:MAG: chemotaxis protein CheR [Flavobacteriaceae bacterium]